MAPHQQWLKSMSSWKGAVLKHDLPDLAAAFAFLFGLMYAMDISYPKKMRYTFEAIQTIFFELGSRCSQRTRSLKEKLLLWSLCLIYSHTHINTHAHMERKEQFKKLSSQSAKVERSAILTAVGVASTLGMVPPTCRQTSSFFWWLWWTPSFPPSPGLVPVETQKKLEQYWVLYIP